MKTPSLLYHTIHLHDTRHNKERWRSSRWSYYGGKRSLQHTASDTYRLHRREVGEWNLRGQNSTRLSGLQQWTGRAVVTVSALVAAASRASIGRVGACWPVAMTTGSHNTAPPPHYDAVILIYSIITNGIDGAVMLFTRTALHVWQRYSRALLSYPALTSLVSLAPCVSLSSPCGRRHYANECSRSMAKLSTATSFVYLRVRSTVFAVHNREIRLS